MRSSGGNKKRAFLYFSFENFFSCRLLFICFFFQKKKTKVGNVPGVEQLRLDLHLQRLKITSESCTALNLSKLRISTLEVFFFLNRV